MSRVIIEFNTVVPRKNLIIQDVGIKKVYFEDNITFYTTAGERYEIKKDVICFIKEEDVDTIQHSLQGV